MLLFSSLSAFVFLDARFFAALLVPEEEVALVFEFFFVVSFLVDEFEAFFDVFVDFFFVDVCFDESFFVFEALLVFVFEPFFDPAPVLFFRACARFRIAEFHLFFTAFSDRPVSNFAISHQRFPIDFWRAINFSSSSFVHGSLFNDVSR